MEKGRAARRSVIAIAAAFAVAGRYEHTFTVGAGAPTGPVMYDHWENFWLGGLIGHKKVDVTEMCPSGDATIETKQTFLNGLVSGLTSGIYTPLTLKIRCASGRRAAVGLTSEDVAAVVRSPQFLEEVARSAPERLDEVLGALEELDR
jgi:hypothetical protein